MLLASKLLHSDSEADVGCLLFLLPIAKPPVQGCSRHMLRVGNSTGAQAVLRVLWPGRQVLKVPLNILVFALAKSLNRTKRHAANTTPCYCFVPIPG